MCFNSDGRDVLVIVSIFDLNRNFKTLGKIFDGKIFK